jgi:hypothetical protein
MVYMCIAVPTRTCTCIHSCTSIASIVVAAIHVNMYQYIGAYPGERAVRRLGFMLQCNLPTATVSVYIYHQLAINSSFCKDSQL